MLDDPSRGAGLEKLLTQVLLHDQSPQLVALSEMASDDFFVTGRRAGALARARLRSPQARGPRRRRQRRCR
jgi:hypothetical protein